jgi:hypothetical protein
VAPGRRKIADRFRDLRDDHYHIFSSSTNVLVRIKEKGGVFEKGDDNDYEEFHRDAQGGSR